MQRGGFQGGSIFLVAEVSQARNLVRIISNKLYVFRPHGIVKNFKHFSDNPSQ